MSNKQNDIWNENLWENTWNMPSSYDNLFSANHRNLMIQHHNGTMAQHITIEQLLENYELN